MNEADLLTVLLHELSNPLYTAVLDLDRLRASLRRIVRVTDLELPMQRGVVDTEVTEVDLRECVTARRGHRRR